MVIHDNNAAGALGLRAIQSASSRSGATVVGTATYEFSQQGVVNAVPGIVSQVRSNNPDSIFFTAHTAGALPLLAQLLLCSVMSSL